MDAEWSLDDGDNASKWREEGEATQKHIDYQEMIRKIMFKIKEDLYYIYYNHYYNNATWQVILNIVLFFILVKSIIIYYICFV